MQPRYTILILASLALACTATNNDDSGGTEVATTTATGTATGTTGETPGTGTGTATTTGGTTSGEPTSTSGAPGSTGPDDPTTTGGSAEATGSETGSGATDEGTDATGAGGVSFTEVYEQIIVPRSCNSGYCHGMGAGGLELTDEATSYANLVDMVAATPVCGQSMRVVPGSLEESIVWYRVRPAALDNGNPCASKMPQASMGLSEAEAQLVDDWIVGGALE